MRWRCFGLVGLLVGIGVNGASAALPFHKKTVLPPLALAIPFEELSSHRHEVRQVIQDPTVTGRGPVETFPCNPEHYFWFLDHPDRASAAWRKLGAKCVAITQRQDGQFGWSDGNGSDVTWKTVYRGPNLRIWYARGKVRPTPVMPLVGVEVVVVLQHTESPSSRGGSLIKHQAEVFLSTDSKAVSVVARMMGTSANRVAEQALGQMQIFFSGLSWYLDQNPHRAEMLLQK